MIKNRTVLSILFIGLACLRLAAVEIEPLWQFVVNGRVLTNPVNDAQGNWYFAADDRALYCINPSGKLLWKQNILYRPHKYISYHPAGLIVISAGTYVFAYNLSGMEIWRFPIHSRLIDNFSINEHGVILFATENNRIFFLDHLGKKRFELSGEERIYAGPVFGGDRYFFIIYADSRLSKYDINGKKQWDIVFESPVENIAFDYQGNVYSRTVSGSLYKLNTDGNLLMHVSHSLKGPVLISGRNVYSHTETTIVAISEFGDLLWESALEKHGVQDMAIGRSIWLLDSSGSLYRFSLRGELISFTKGQDKNRLGSLGNERQYLSVGENWIVECFQAEAGVGPWFSQYKNSYQEYSSAAQAVSSLTDPALSYLHQLKNESTYFSYEMLLSELERYYMNQNKNSTDSAYLDLVQQIASLGLLHLSRGSFEHANDFPTLRARAYDILQDYGTLKSLPLLLRLLALEWDAYAAGKLIEAIGKLASDREAIATQSLVLLFQNRPRFQTDFFVVEKILDAFKSIMAYNGRYASDAELQLIYTIFQGAYPQSIRQKALDVLRESSYIHGRGHL